MISSNDILVKSRNVILKMLEMRGYDVSDYKNFNLKEIENMIQNLGKKPNKTDPTPLDMKCNHMTTNHTVHVLYNFNSKLKIQNIETILNKMIEEDTIKDNDKVIILSKDTISDEHEFDSQLDALYKKMDNKYFTQVFTIEKLLINIMKHELVPEHKIISEEQKRAMLKQFDISNFSQLPIILKTDPVAKFLGMQRGDVCEITKPSETAGEYVYYRYCQ